MQASVTEKLPGQSEDLVPEDHLGRNSREDYGGSGTVKRGNKGKTMPAGLNRETADRLWSQQSKQAEESRTPAGWAGRGRRKQAAAWSWPFPRRFSSST